MEKKITISVITQEGNYGGEATGHTMLYTTVYFYLRRLFSKQTCSGRLSASTKHSWCISSSFSMDESRWVSISSEVDWTAAICLILMHTHSIWSEVNQWINLTTTKPANTHHLQKPKEHLMSHEESAERFILLFSFFFSFSPWETPWNLQQSDSYKHRLELLFVFLWAAPNHKNTTSITPEQI